jgi:hypothetical protein
MTPSVRPGGRVKARALHRHKLPLRNQPRIAGGWGRVGHTQAVGPAAPAARPRRLGFQHIALRAGCRSACGCRRAGAGRTPRAPAVLHQTAVSITATRSANLRTRFRSCVISSTAMPLRAATRSAGPESAAHGHVQRGGGLVGQQQPGLQASAMAIMARWRCPPRAGAGRPARAARARQCRYWPAVRPPPAQQAAASPMLELQHLGNLIAHGETAG